MNPIDDFDIFFIFVSINTKIKEGLIQTNYITRKK